MNIGYILGCLFSILFKSIDKEKIVNVIYLYLNKKFKKDIIFLNLLCISCFLFIYLINLIKNQEILNFITFFICIDISNTEFHNLKNRENCNFYSSIGTINKALIGGFIGPIFYTLILGNYGAILFYTLFLLRDILNYKILNKIVEILIIIPCFIGDILFFIIYIIKNRKVYIDFKGDLFLNSLFNPQLTLNIIAANIESVNLYYFNEKEIKYYLNGKRELSLNCIKEFLSFTYISCFICFMCFILLKMNFYKIFL